MVVLFQSWTKPQLSHFWRKVTTVPRSFTILPPVISIAKARPRPVVSLYPPILSHPTQYPGEQRATGVEETVHDVEVVLAGEDEAFA